MHSSSKSVIARVRLLRSARSLDSTSELLAGTFTETATCSSEANGVATCNIPQLTKTFDALRRSAGFKAIYARHDLPQRGNAVYFVIAEYGFVGT